MGTIQNGLKAGLKTTWSPGKGHFSNYCACCYITTNTDSALDNQSNCPIHGAVGLSGEAAIPLVLGNALNLFAGIAGILSLDLTVKEVFIIAVMLSFSHNIFIETASH